MTKLDAAYMPSKSGEVRQLVVFLHGYGANGEDLLSIGDEWRDALPDAVFVSPNAPEICEAFAGGFQWFSIRAIDRDAFERERQIEKAAPVLNDFLDSQLAHWHLDDSALAVAGFSQGAMMAMYTMPRRAKACAGVIGYSGMLISAAGLKEPHISKMPVLAIHGAEDTIVPPTSLTQVADGFEAAGFNVETVMRPHLAHGIDAFGITRGQAFLQDCFGLNK